MNSTKKGPGKGNYLRKPRVYALPPELGIDEQATLTEFGYPASSVSPAGNKKVICYCQKCGKTIARIRIRVVDPVLCPSCVKAKKDSGSPLDFVDEVATLAKYHYNVKQLPRYSLNKVIGICSTCNGHFDIRLSAVRHGQRCRSCIRKEWCNTHLGPRKSSGEHLLNDSQTFIRFGYSATSRSPKSFEKVCATCPQCHVVYERVRRNVNDTSVCAECGRRDINHSALQAKRLRTILDHYPEGFPQPSSACYGKVVHQLAQTLSKVISRPLLQEVPLSDGKRLDLVDPEMMVAIEYCGLFWHHEHSPQPRMRNYHADKMLTASKDGYRLITIFEDEYLQRPAAVTHRLLSILKYYSSQVSARKCTLQPESDKTAKEYLEKHHIQGPPAQLRYALGLRYNGELVGMLTAGDHHRQGHANELILSRLCFGDNIRVIGGSKRLFRHLCQYARDHSYKQIKTWSDNRWTNGDVYAHLGMTLEADTKPDYFYVDTHNPRCRLSKQSQRKKTTNCPNNTTEYDWALQRGLSRIWDCGHKSWVFPL